jgi:hypothetical protein
VTAVARYANTSGTELSNSLVLVDGNGNITLPSGQIVGGRNSAGSYVVVNLEHYLTFVTTSGASVVLNSSPQTWESHIIKDGTGQAGISPISIFGSGDLIDGATSVSIASNWASIEVVYNGTQWGII